MAVQAVGLGFRQEIQGNNLTLSFLPGYVQELPARAYYQLGIVNMTGAILKTSVCKLMRAERVVGQGSVKNHKMVRILEKGFISKDL